MLKPQSQLIGVGQTLLCVGRHKGSVNEGNGCSTKCCLSYTYGQFAEKMGESASDNCFIKTLVEAPSVPSLREKMLSVVSEIRTLH